MGFLDHTTNAIILDTVLTDYGRQALSKNDRSFTIYKFALGDDEVDYTIIKKYGRAVGKEKIEKNTPVFEASTNAYHALKYKLVSISNPNLIRLPELNLVGNGASTNIIQLGVRTGSGNKTAVIDVSQEIQGENTIDVELRDNNFIVEMSDLFLQIPSIEPDVVDDQRRAKYTLRRSANQTSTGGSKLQFTLQVKAVTDAQFDVYGTTSNKNLINTYVRLTGTQSGSVLEFRVDISK